MEEKKDENIKQKTNKFFTIEKMKTIIIITLFILLVLTNLGDSEQSKNVTTSNNYNTNINQELAELKSKYNLLENELEEYQSNISSLTDKNNKLTDENKQLQEKVTQLEKEKATTSTSTTSSSNSSNSKTTNKSSSSTTTSSNLNTKSNTDQSTTVYITKTGKKYHRSSCSSLSKSKIPISLSEAKNQGYTACKNCKP